MPPKKKTHKDYFEDEEDPDFDDFGPPPPDPSDPPHPPHGPPPPFGPHNPPPFGSYRRFFRSRFPHPPPLGGPFFGQFGMDLPMRKENIHELRYFFILNLLNDYPEGITAYQLQENFRFPRGNLLRILEDLEEKNYVDIKETVVNGRAQKLYSITQEGKDFIENFKKKWAGFFSNMSDYAPFEKFGNPFIEKNIREILLNELSECKDKEEAIDLVRGMRIDIVRRRNKIQERLEMMDDLKKNIDELVKFLENEKDLNIENIRKFIENQKDR